MAELTIRWTKKRDGTFTMHCLRSNGTGTWSRSRPGDFFFAHHDLSHYAIETTLRLKRAFWGLVAEGWDLEDFGTPWPRGRIPIEAASDATLAETCAGMMDLARATGERPDATQLNASISDYYSNHGMTHAAFRKTSSTQSGRPTLNSPNSGTPCRLGRAWSCAFLRRKDRKPLRWTNTLSTF